jgi:phosphate:Na+ symporter
VQNIAETIGVNRVAIGRERLARGMRFGSETVERARVLSKRVREAFELAIQALENPEHARQVVAMKQEIQDLVAKIVEHLAQRFLSKDPHRTVLYRLETQAVEIIQREYYFAKKIAKEIIRLDEDSIEDPVIKEELVVAVNDFSDCEPG